MGKRLSARGILALTALLATSALALRQSASAPVADMIVMHGKIYTVNTKQPWAQAVAIRGSIESGKLADLIILSQNLFEVDPHRIAETKVVTTIVGGRLVYRSDAR